MRDLRRGWERGAANAFCKRYAVVIVVIVSIGGVTRVHAVMFLSTLSTPSSSLPPPPSTLNQNPIPQTSTADRNFQVYLQTSRNARFTTFSTATPVSKMPCSYTRWQPPPPPHQNDPTLLPIPQNCNILSRTPSPPSPSCATTREQTLKTPVHKCRIILRCSFTTSF
jgi:hypothetical protein